MTAMARRIRTGWTALTGTGAAVSAVLAMLVIAIVFVAVGAATTDYSSLAVALGLVPGAPGAQLDQVEIDAVRAEVARNLARLALPLAPASAQWSGLASGYSAVSGAARSAYDGTTAPQVEVLYRSSLGRFARLVAGRMPAGDIRRTARFQIAVTAATAARFGLHPGSTLRIGTSMTLAVTGILQPIEPRSAFWTADPNAAAASFNRFPGSLAGYWLGAVFIGPAAIMLIMLVLGARSRELTLARLSTMGLSPGQARRLVVAGALPLFLAAAVGGVACAGVLVPLIGPAIDLSVLTGTGSPVPVRADFPVLGYAAAGLLAVALATLLVQAATTRIRGAARALRVGE